MKKTLLIFLFLFISLQAITQTRQAFVRAASSAKLAGDYYSASLYYKQALEFDEDDLEVIYQLAEVSRLYHDYTGAVLGYEKCVLLDTKQRKTLATFYAGEMRKCLGAYAEAQKHFQNYYNVHAGDSNFFSRKSFLQLAACDTAQRLIKNPGKEEISGLGNTVNTIYNDFAGQQMDDSIIYFSSQRFLEEGKTKKKEKAYVSKILTSKNEKGSWNSPVLMDRILNPSGFLNCNSNISADHRYLFFSRCTSINVSTYHAELYVSKWENGKWKSPSKLGNEINSKEYTSTQPAVATNGASGYILYFSSDRPGGFGGMDIWRSTFSNGMFGSPENLGPEINSQGNEITPFFDNLSSTFYFSSDWHAGLGGYDVFHSEMKNGVFTNVVNMGYPLNSSCDDIYFTVTKTGKEGLLTSNRPGSMYLYTQTCCYDVYRYVIPELQIQPVDSAAIIDSLFLVEKMNRIVDSTKLTVFLPLKLYFDNDQPGRRTLDTITSKTYDETYVQYLSAKKEYLGAFNDKIEKESMQAAVEDFFQNTLETSYKNLDKFASSLLLQLETGRKIAITVQGCASPLAKDDYNEKLSKRRISSLLNFLKKYKNGQLNDYIQNGSLVISEDAAGERLALKNVSDNYKDKRKSVYHPDACLERRIEVIAIRYLDE